MKDDSFDCTLIAHLRIFLLFYRLLYCLILPENRLFFGIWKVVEIDNDLKYLSKDGIIKTILNIDPNSVANFGYDVVTGTIKSIKSAGKLGNTIADLAVG